MENTKPHPLDPPSNVAKFGGYDPDKYVLDNISTTVRTHEDLTPGAPPRLTQDSIGLFLQPTTRELVEVPPRPTIDELPDAVIERMVQRDKAFWVDKPGANAYTLHDAYYNYGMTTERIFTPHQDVFPRSYQYDLDCVKYRREHACDGLKVPASERKKPLAPHCRDCKDWYRPGLTPFQLAWAQDAVQQRWRYYPDLTKDLTLEEIRDSMSEYYLDLPPYSLTVTAMVYNDFDSHFNITCGVGRPFQHEACSWYCKNYPSEKYNCILRKFSK